MSNAVGGAAGTRRGAVLRFAKGHPRTLAGFASGLAVYWLLGIGDEVGSAVRAVIAWNAGAAVFLVLASVQFLTTRPAQMPAYAERQAEGEWTIFWITIGAVLFSFGTIVQALSGVSHLAGPAMRERIVLVAMTLLLSWLLTQAVFALKYAHAFYRAGPEGRGILRGLQFPEEDEPDYWDFVYFSVVIGMTFQVSDVGITARRLRRLAALHGFLGFLFNTVIIAVTVNSAAALI